MYFILLTLLTFGAWANPFAPFLVPNREEAGVFHPQKPPFEYPFKVVDEVERRKLDLPKFIQKNSQDALSATEQMYQEYKFDLKTSVYAFPFPLHPEWEMLPHPFVSDLQGTEPTVWVESFKKKLGNDQGVRSFAFQQTLDRVTNSKAYAGNKLRLLKTPNSYREIIQRINSAKEHVFFSTFLFQCDTGTQDLLTVIEKKVNAGVPVFVMMDSLMSRADPTCKKKLRALGANVALQGSLTKIFHEKMLITDAKFAMIDGQNMLGPQTLSDGVNNLINDQAVGVEGPMVAVIAQRFIELWGMKTKKRPPMPAAIKDQYAALAKEAESASSEAAIKAGLAKGEGVCRLVTKAPFKSDVDILNLYLETVRHSQNYLFFNLIDLVKKDLDGKTPSEKFLRAVVDELNSKPELRVDMLTNNWKRPIDIFVKDQDTRNLFAKIVTRVGGIIWGQQFKHIPKLQHNLAEALTSPNFHWWSYAQYMHAKTLMSDNIWTLIGSYNINNSSQKQSYEQTLACVDSQLASEMQNSIVIDALNSLPIFLRK